MSERPQSIATGMVDSSISIGNYKGVMLCNRPFAGAAGGAAAAAARLVRFGETTLIDGRAC